MTTSEAKEILLLHSFFKVDDQRLKPEKGFLRSLRPYRGHLVEESFHEVIAALKILAPSLQQPTVDSEVVSALWHICHLARSWGVHPDGMLRRNGLISADDVQRLEDWVDCISYATMVLLGNEPGSGGVIEEAFHMYDTRLLNNPLERTKE